MPVGTPFNQQFHFGDVIYGVSHGRIPYINSLNKFTVLSLRENGMYMICDEYNNRTFNAIAGGQGVGTKAGIKHNLLYNKTGAHLDPLTLKQPTQYQKVAQQQYYQALSSSKHAPLKAVKTSVANAQAKGNQNVEDLVFRRACKFGLQYIIEQQHKTVHFVLDVPAHLNVPGNRLDSLDVVLKTQHAGHVPITTSELRSCYRNRAAWVPTGRLKFYFNLLEVNPPWIDDPAIWSVYEAHRINKGAI